MSVYHAPAVEHLEQRHNRHTTRDEQPHQDEDEQRILTPETDPGEGVSGQGRDGHRADRDERRDVHAIEVLPRERLRSEDVTVCGEADVGGDE